ncbi:bifunctional UDP-N-acetylglucosamine diphosphorylase/glucosamine-1-phosphate N-acetyltransferase GlmU [Donghicola tyrosinivorans]|uniref:Bifunctional protein GlmU n=1 Tax=Donghicola tyrosinivorans TaxID=1652492 RepID=A0A2T0WX02_9RHOB|nr:bifunctional UDP-N-acetylglucosamine diphosphorylase/glucosamine-1-phosphate N-acetyltransferase GlmU [Donghicola tyrosinivorans]PRY91205.1 bifunctional UDP-N-acetylglucosamine pyrophosphorylase/glucosamine-1-phosphate N-acetyltransferase [Donghicola tyrosinivorans]
MATALIVLAAGQGTRMNSDLPKVLHKVASAPLMVHALKSGASLAPERQIVVAGHGAAEVTKAAQDWDEEIKVVLQEEQLGTAHAVAQARPALDGFKGDAIILYGDTPFIRPETLEAMVEARRTHDVVVLGFEAADPGRYGRLVMNGDKLERIVEFKDASEAERAITLCNSGVVCADADVLFDLIEKVGNDNASGEYYLTDIVGLAWDTGRSATAVTCTEAETMGVNTRAQLAEAEAEFQSTMRAEALENGVTLTAPETVFFAHDTIVGRETIIEPNVVFGPDVTVESGAVIRAFSHLEGCHVSRGAIIGPYARLRPGAEIGEEAHIGNFVEVKNAQIHEGAKANHLTYIGDATVGKGTNIGAGTITCNYDGFFKHHTEIGERAFIGSSTMLVAPVRVGNGAMTGSGSVITKDVEDGALALGRAAQVNKPGMAEKLFDMLRAKKAKAGK